jgi:RNA polymerase sigma-70 factor (ECF subfamily)
MTSLALTLTQPGLDGRGDLYSVKMVRVEEEQVMVQPGNEQLLNKEDDEASCLKDLIRRGRDGDIQAFEAIYQRFKIPLFNIAFRYTYDRQVSEDLLQDVFIKVFTHFREVREEKTFVGWLYRIAVNTCYSYLRQKRSEAQKTISLSEVEAGIGETVSESDVALKKSLDDAIKDLPGKLNAVFLLHDVQGFKHEEIAGMMSWSVGTSKSQLFKARMKVRQFLGKKKAL